MPERDFEIYLSLLAKMLRLSPRQRDAIADELRDHMEDRLEELIAKGLTKREAIESALEEFGDAAGLAQRFTSLATLRRRRLIMRYSFASLATLALGAMVVLSILPERRDIPTQPLVIANETARDVETAVTVVHPEHLRWPVTYSRHVVVKSPLSAICLDVIPGRSDHVSDGRVIARFDDALQRGQVTARKTELELAELVHEEQLIRHGELARLLEHEAVQEYEVRVQQLNLKRSELDVKYAEVMLELEQTRLSRYQVRAPFDAEVMLVHASPGSHMHEGETILTLGSRKSLEMNAHFPIALMQEMKVGMEYQFDAEAPVNRPLTGKLVAVDQSINPAAQTFSCVFAFENPDLALPAGFKARLIWPQP